MGMPIVFDASSIGIEKTNAKKTQATAVCSLVTFSTNTGMRSGVVSVGAAVSARGGRLRRFASFFPGSTGTGSLSSDDIKSQRVSISTSSVARHLSRAALLTLARIHVNDAV